MLCPQLVSAPHVCPKKSVLAGFNVFVLEREQFLRLVPVLLSLNSPLILGNRQYRVRPVTYIYLNVDLSTYLTHRNNNCSLHFFYKLDPQTDGPGSKL